MTDHRLMHPAPRGHLYRCPLFCAYLYKGALQIIPPRPTSCVFIDRESPLWAWAPDPDNLARVKLSPVSKFKPLVRDVGARNWMCPDCGHWQRSSMYPGRYKFKCKGCGHIWVIGYAFYKLTTGPRPRPLDTVFPDWGQAPPFMGGVVLGVAPRDRLNVMGDDLQEGGGPGEGPQGN